MKSVGEAMAIGRTFPELLQKALRSLETGLDGLDEIEIDGLGHGDDHNVLRAAIGQPTPDRLLNVAQAMRLGMGVEEIHECSKIDPWFLERIAEIVALEGKVRAHGLPPDAGNMRALKASGFSDARLAALTGKAEADVAASRKRLGVQPVFKRIDTCAAEFASPTAYMYSTYEAPFAGKARCEADPSEREKIVILGGGPNRIGQGIEFDYCCCHAAFSLSAAGYETIMVNCNPETVSTDYDTSGPSLFRAADRRGRAGHSRQGARAWAPQGRDRAVRRPDAAQARPCRSNRRASPILGTSVELDRSRRGPRPLQAPARQTRPEAAEERHRLFGRAVAPHRRRSRAAARRAPVLCAGRPGDGDHPRSERARRLSAWRLAEPRAVRRQGALPERQDRPDQHGSGQEPAAVRPLPRGRDRDRRRCA